MTDDPMLDEAWLAAPTSRSRGRMLLVGALGAALCFFGGALAQKHLGTEPAAAAAGPAGFGGGQLPEGMPDLGAGFPGATGGDVTDQATTDDGTETVIGKVVEIDGDVWIVEDLGGERHEVTIGEDTGLVWEAPIEANEVKVGETVDITGSVADTDNDDGPLRADEVTVR